MNVIRRPQWNCRSVATLLEGVVTAESRGDAFSVIQKWSSDLDFGYLWFSSAALGSEWLGSLKECNYPQDYLAARQTEFPDKDPVCNHGVGALRSFW